MKCYFLRHGIAVEPESWSGADFDRPLTREGRSRMERQAEAIAQLALGIERIVSSPLLRAKQTADILAAQIGMRGRVNEDRRLGGGFDIAALDAILGAHADADIVILVGHQPSMGSTIGRAIGAASIELKKAALAGVEFPAHLAANGTLLCLIPPKVLLALGKR